MYPVSPSSELGGYVAAAANVLADDAEVTVVTTDLHQERHAELASRSDPALPSGARFLFVPEPDPGEPVDYFNRLHVWSGRVYEALKAAYPDGGPDLVEFPDLGAEGAVTVQAKRTLDPALRNTTVAVRAYASQEMRDVLNGYLPTAKAMRTVYDLERYALKYADCFLWPGGDVLGTYQRFFGAEGLAPQKLVRQLLPQERASSVETASLDGTFRFLYPGRLERRNGVLNLLRAVTSLERDDWSLTVLGEDTRTAPFGVSMRAQLELMAADDERIDFREPVERDAMRDLIARHDAAILPSLWECWSLSALQAFDRNRPVLATPVGGFLEMIEDGVSGWLADGTDASALAAALERVLDHREAAAELMAAEEPRTALHRFDDPERTREQYLELAANARRKRTGGPLQTRERDRPLVSAVVPYYQLDRYVGETVASLFDQTHVPIEVLVVNDGSFREEDRVLEELGNTYPISIVTQENSGLGAARNFGIRQARGRYIFPLDADNVAIASFVERCVDVLEEHEDVAYVTSWSRFVYEDGIPSSTWAEGYRPLSNDAPTLAAVNTAGDAAAVIRRSVFEQGFWYTVDAAGSYEDWLFYRELARAGLYGHVIPERLLVYRVREASMLRNVGLPRHKRLIGEMDAFLREREVQWTTR